MPDVKTIRIGDPDNRGAWLQVTLPWRCPVPECRRPWPEPRMRVLGYLIAGGTVHVRVHYWPRRCACGHLVLDQEVVHLAAQWARE